MNHDEKINEILRKAKQCGMLYEVVKYALEEMNSNKSTTPLLAMQIAAYEFDIL